MSQALTGDNLTNLISSLQDYQDLVTVNELKGKNPANLQAYVSDKKKQLLSDIHGTKSRAFEKAYNGSLMSADNYVNTLYYYRRNKELLDTNEALAKKSLMDAKAVVFNDDLAKRQFEINEWTVNNKRDTLFIFQFAFICVLIVTMLTYLNKANLIPGGFYGWLILFIAIIFCLTVAYRAVQTNNLRDKFYWSRRKFGRYGPPASGGGNNCLVASANEFESDIRAKATSVGDQLQSYWDSTGDYFGRVGNALSTI